MMPPLLCAERESDEIAFEAFEVASDSGGAGESEFTKAIGLGLVTCPA